MNTDKEQEVIERLVTVEQRARSNTHRIDGIEKDIENVKSLEVLINKHDEEIKILKDQSSTIYKLAVNHEVMNNTLSNMVDDNKKQMVTFTTTLENMNDSLLEMNSTQKQMSSEIQNMQMDITSTKNHVKEVEDLANKNKERGKFDMLNFWTNDGTKVIMTAIIVAILSYIGLK